MNKNLVTRNGKKYRDWWRTQIELLVKFATAQITGEFGIGLTAEQVKRRIEIEDDTTERIMREIDRLNRYEEV